MSNDQLKARQVSLDDAKIATRLRQLRYKRGLSQTEVANELGISFQQFQKYEQGRNRISAARLVAIARILGVTPHDILHWRDEEDHASSLRASASFIDQKWHKRQKCVAGIGHKVMNQRGKRRSSWIGFPGRDRGGF